MPPPVGTRRSAVWCPCSDLKISPVASARGRAGQQLLTELPRQHRGGTASCQPPRRGAGGQEPDASKSQAAEAAQNRAVMSTQSSTSGGETAPCCCGHVPQLQRAGSKTSHVLSRLLCLTSILCAQPLLCAVGAWCFRIGAPNSNRLFQGEDKPQHSARRRYAFFII